MTELPRVTIMFCNLIAVRATYQIAANVHRICEISYTGSKNKSVETDLHTKYLYFEMHQNGKCFDKQDLEFGYMGASVKFFFFFNE